MSTMSHAGSKESSCIAVDDEAGSDRMWKCLGQAVNVFYTSDDDFANELTT